MKTTTRLLLGGAACALVLPLRGASPNSAGQTLEVRSGDTSLQCFWFAKWYESPGGGVTCYGGGGADCVSCKK